ncbi:MAG: hypothetical protein ACJ72E_09125 [Marmoricola sp.]
MDTPELAVNRAVRRSLYLPVASAVLMAVGITASAATPRQNPGDVSGLVAAISFVAPVAIFGLVGALITARRPGHVIGWMLAAISLLFSVVVACSSTAHWGLESGRIPVHLAEWIDVPSNLWVIALGLIGTQLLLRMPDGTLPSPRWRWYSRFTVLAIGVALVGMTAQTTPLEGVSGTRSPLASHALEVLASAFLVVIVGFVVSIVALVMRYRRASGHDRAQLRWVAFSGVAFVVIYVATLLLGNALDSNGVAGNINTSFSQAAFAALPIGIGFAVLRQNLYDIDVVINRALVYGSTTALLAGTYLGSVLLLQLLLNRFTSGSGLAVAVSTLATAALVRPARARIQRAVDRRFFRRRYDAALTLSAFGVRVRREVDLDALTTELRTVVAETLQPAHVSLWVRSTESTR